MAGLPASILPNETSLYQGVWVVVPSVGSHRTEFTLALLNMGAPINTNCGIYMPIGMKVDEARNIFAQAAIDHNVKYLMFIDEDVLVAPHTMRRLVYWLETYDDLDAVGGVYCAKDPADPDAKPFPLVFRGDGAGPYWDWRYGEFFEVSGLGMGCTMIRVSTLKKMEGPWFLTQRYSENVRNSKGEITGKHHFCFPPGQWVLTQEGWKPIQAVEARESVLTRYGRYRPVYQTLKRSYSGPMVRFKPALFEAVECTPDHPVLAVRAQKWSSGHGRTAVRKPDGKFDYPEPDWVPAGELTRDHIVVFRIDETVATVDSIRLDSPYPAHCRTVPVGPELLRFIGYWLAEGSANPRGGDVALTFHKAEAEYLEDVRELFRSVFGLEPRVERPDPRNPNVRTVWACSVPLVRWLRANFGSGARSKRIPTWVMHLEPALQAQLLKGFIRGDGHWHGWNRSAGTKKTCYPGLSLGSASKPLVLQLRTLLLRQGVVPSFYREEERSGFSAPDSSSWCLVLGGSAALELKNKLEPELELPWRPLKKHIREGWVRGGWAWLPVRQVEHFEYSGDVYNLSVEDDESYTVSSCTVSNCGTEDLYFFRRLREELGGKIYCDGSLVFDHIDKDGRRYGLPPDCKIMRPTTFNGKPFGNEGKVVLNLGCGPMYDIFEEGIAIRVDLREEAKPDYRADLRNLPFEDEFADLVFSSHTLEHFGRWEIEAVLKEWIRVLKPGGILRLVVPNLLWAAEKIIENRGLVGPNGPDVLNVLYGEQNYALNFHQMGFTEDLLRSLVMTYGIEPRFSTTGYSLIMEGRKKGTWVDPVQASMRKKVKAWIRTAGEPLPPDAGAAPAVQDAPPEPEPESAEEAVRGWTLDQTPKAFSVFWDPNREAEVALAYLTRKVQEHYGQGGEAQRSSCVGS